MGNFLKNMWDTYNYIGGGLFAFIIISILIKEGLDSFKNIFLLLFKPKIYFRNNEEEIVKKYISGNTNNHFIKKILHDTLKELGIYNIEEIRRNIKILKELIVEEELDSDILKFREEYETELKKIIIESIDNMSVEVGVSGGRSATYNYYVNLRKKLINFNFSFKISNLLIGHIKDIKNNNVNYNYIVVPRDGSQILGYFISLMLEIPLLIANDKIKWKTNQEGIFIDGDIDYNDFTNSLNNKKILLLDDAISGGNLIKKVVNVLQKHGVKNIDIFTVICRKEKKCLEEYRIEENINYYPFMEVDDTILKQLIKETNK